MGIYIALHKKFSPDVELAWRYGLELQRQGIIAPASSLCITGTNGKTTVTGMLNNMLCWGGVESCVAGNIGTPVT